MRLAADLHRRIRGWSRQGVVIAEEAVKSGSVVGVDGADELMQRQRESHQRTA